MSQRFDGVTLLTADTAIDLARAELALVSECERDGSEVVLLSVGPTSRVYQIHRAN